MLNTKELIFNLQFQYKEIIVKKENSFFLMIKVKLTCCYQEKLLLMEKETILSF